MPSYASEFHFFVTNHRTEKAGDSFQQSGSSRLHFGLSNPTMRDFVKNWKTEHANLSETDWFSTMDGLYAGVTIDEACLAGFMLGEYAQFRQGMDLCYLDQWIGTLEGWREIDTTCQSNFTAKEVLYRWDEWHALLSDFATRPTISHRRASLVLLNRPLRQESSDCLINLGLENVERLKSEKDKLITKAVSWTLRTAIKNHRVTVSTYVDQNRDSLPLIAVREFERKLSTGKK